MQIRAILVGILIALFWLAPSPSTTQAARREHPAGKPRVETPKIIIKPTTNPANR